MEKMSHFFIDKAAALNYVPKRVRATCERSINKFRYINNPIFLETRQKFHTLTAKTVFFK